MNEIDIVGIDLGTTKSVVAIWDPDLGAPRVLPNREGQTVTPSVVAFDPKAGFLVGRPAADRLLTHPEQVAYSVKRFIGRTFREPTVGEDQRRVTYPLEETPEHRVRIALGDRKLAPPEVSAQVLRQLKEDAQAVLGREVRRAVISVPAYFNDAQRQATIDAAGIAGFETEWDLPGPDGKVVRERMRIINEPTAAALAFGLGEEPQTVAVYDLGGGTFDISMLEVKRGLFRVRAIGGDTHLGGDDFDQAVVDWMAAEFQSRHEAPLAQDPAQRARLREAAREAKKALSEGDAQPIRLGGLHAADGRLFDLEVTLTRAGLEQLIGPFLQRSLALVDGVLRAARLRPEALGQVLLVGGQTRTPAAREALRARYGRPLNTSVSPEEAVARGAAILAARLCGHLKERVDLMDVLPLTLGIEVHGGLMEPIARANQPIPLRVEWRGERGFTTNRDGQERIQFRLYQGERTRASDNILIGEATLNLPAPRARGEIRVDCTFRVDQDGIVHLAARDVDTGEEVAAVFDRLYRLSPEEVEAHLRAAREHRAEDEATRRLAQLDDEAGQLRRRGGPFAPGGALAGRLDELEAAVATRDLARAEEILDELRRAP
jgi:molecular chaperone DnaK